MTQVKSIKCPRCHSNCLWDGNPFRPFCSERCKLIDLGAWASESYRIKGSSPLDQESYNEEVKGEDPDQDSSNDA